MKRFLLALAVASAALAAVFAEPVPPAAPAVPAAEVPAVVTPVAAAADAPGVTTEKGVVYDAIGGEQLLLDLARPTAAGPHPCVVLLHGGAWVGGSRSDLSGGAVGRDGRPSPSLIEQLAARGYVVASVGYRLAPKHPFPAQIQDARAAVRFLRANAKGYGIDPDRFAAGGFSAGGHLALLLGLADRVEGWDAGKNLHVSPKVQCVVDFFGPTDLTLYTTESIRDSYLVPVFGKEARTNADVLKKASPLSYASKAAPPVLMFHGTFDVVVPVIHSEALDKKLRDAGAPVCELVTLFAEGHGWSGRAFARTVNQTLAFLDTHLKGKK